MHGKRSLLLLSLLLIAPGSAKALTLNVTGGSVDLAQGCSDAFCFTQLYELGLGGDVSGTITTDGATIDVDLTIPLWSISTIAGLDGLIDSIQFQGVNYQASFAHNGSLTDFNGAGIGTAVGDFQLFGPMILTLPVPLNLAPAIDVDCEETAASVYKCGVIIAGLTFPIDISNTETRYVPHTIDLTAVPEPGASVMGLTVGLLGLAYARRKALN